MNPWRFRLRRNLSTRGIGCRLRLTRWWGVVRPPLPIRAIDAVVERQYTIFAHSLGSGPTTCRAFALRRCLRQRLFLRRRCRFLLRRRRHSFLRHRGSSFLRRCSSFLRRRYRLLLRRRWNSFLRRRCRSVLRRCSSLLRRRSRFSLRRRWRLLISPRAVALPNGADDTRHNHQ
jgi:hypothetical protein